MINQLIIIWLVGLLKMTAHNYVYSWGQGHNPFASYAHPPIVRDSANVHEIGSHILVADDRYPRIVATARKSYVILYLKKHHSKS